MTEKDHSLGFLINFPGLLNGLEIPADHFRIGHQREAWAAVRELREVGEPINLISVAEHCSGNGIATWLSEITSGLFPISPEEFRRRILNERAEDIKRQVQSLAQGSAPDLDELMALIEEARALELEAETGKHAELAERAAHSVNARSVPYLWRDVIPTHMAVAITGEPGIAKSLVTVDMTARVSTGRAFPAYGNAGPAVCGHVFYVTSEGVPEMILVPRLIAAGADLNKVTIIEGSCLRNGDFAMFDLTQHLPRLERRAKNFPDLKMIVIDPIASFLPERINPNQGNQVRQAMDRVSSLAYNLGIAAPTVMHFSKAAGVKAIHRTSGSVQFEASVKMSWAVVRREGDPRNARLLVPQKSNITGAYESLSFIIQESKFPSPADPDDIITTAKIEWGSLVDDDPETLISPPIEGLDNHVATAVRFLTRKLAEGKTLYAVDLINEAEEAGVPKWALYKAKDRLGVAHDKEGHYQGRTLWFKPTKEQKS